ncbi:NYN domain-containing protein [Pseudothauera nasutitermitis]|uniref:NYN domain-containing protein n=1 Tax=Pseudothauera nasutitermitis TaxID=2565930 RepID=A0A4S4B3Z9_9RHOO|nr:NYN domain-containing protein [Pseudothauera nasutitermitis]THF67295.1 NYN domain-containing protein [Pseudothauera nasutitermitis]
MDRYAIFVDAGYFFAAGAQATFGNQTPRKQIALKSPAAMLADLCGKASLVADRLPLLRTYWYDAMPGPRLSLEQSALAMLTGIKLRLGVLNSVGEQKGVDSQIVTDLIDLARNRAIADAVLVTGDEDLRIAVQVAQSYGVRVHILAAGDPSKNVSSTLQMEADSVAVLDADWFAAHFELLPATAQASIAAAPVPAAPAGQVATPATGTPAADEIGTAATVVIEAMLKTIAPEQLEQLVQHFSTQQTVPPEYDRPLVAKVSVALSGRRFIGAEMRHIRGLFVRAVKDHSSAAETT